MFDEEETNDERARQPFPPSDRAEAKPNKKKATRRTSSKEKQKEKETEKTKQDGDAGARANTRKKKTEREEKKKQTREKKRPKHVLSTFVDFSVSELIYNKHFYHRPFRFWFAGNPNQNTLTRSLHSRAKVRAYFRLWRSTLTGGRRRLGRRCRRRRRPHGGARLAVRVDDPAVRLLQLNGRNLKKKRKEQISFVES